MLLLYIYILYYIMWSVKHTPSNKWLTKRQLLLRLDRSLDRIFPWMVRIVGSKLLLHSMFEPFIRPFCLYPGTGMRQKHNCKHTQLYTKIIMGKRFNQLIVWFWFATDTAIMLRASPPPIQINKINKFIPFIKHYFGTSTPMVHV